LKRVRRPRPRVSALDRERRLRRHNELLVALGKSTALADGDLERSLAEITEAAAHSLNVRRASVWHYSADRTSIVCADLYDADRAVHERGTVLHARDFPGYFEALEQERTVAARDARRDPRTLEFADVYLRPLGIASMLDAPIRQQGRMTGVICHEHVGKLRAWTLDEQTFAGSMADCVALAVAAAERKQAEVALAERVAELARSNAELEQFAYVASHDLQEPLRMVSNYVALLDRRYRGKLDADADKHIGYAVEGAKRMRGLIRDLLMFSRAGRVGHQPGPVDAHRAAEAARANLRVLIEETGATVTIAPLPTVLTWDSQLVRVFQNIIENGIKYRGEAVPQVEVSAERQDTEWIFRVKDNGIGIDSKYFEKIFRIFQRLHDRRTYGGSGIGLAIAKRIVEHHGGRIWVESAPGQGSTFSFTAKAA
jgi:signal transduction histidine kinase